jgi:magnesium-transporting ATPase (P-type)
LVFNSKKGMIEDGVLVLVFLTLFAIITFVGYTAFTEINTDIQNDDDLSNVSKSMSGDLHTKYPAMFDGAFLTIFVLLWIYTLVAAFFSSSHPIFLVIGVILLLFIFSVGMLLSNTYDSLFSDVSFGSLSSSFPYTDFIMSNFVTALIVVGVSILLSMFMGSRQ